jgi:hypothetical protein
MLTAKIKNSIVLFNGVETTLNIIETSIKNSDGVLGDGSETINDDIFRDILKDIILRKLASGGNRNAR